MLLASEKGNVEDNLEKSTEKEGIQEKNRCVFICVHTMEQLGGT
jgi:hypothetical protein